MELLIGEKYIISHNTQNVQTPNILEAGREAGLHTGNFWVIETGLCRSQNIESEPNINYKHKHVEFTILNSRSTHRSTVRWFSGSCTILVLLTRCSVKTDGYMDDSCMVDEVSANEG